MKTKTNNENVKFRLIQMPCCNVLLCYVNPRLPNYCSECGARVFSIIKANPSVIIMQDDEAWLKYNS